MVFATGAARHQNITEVDETPEGNKRKKNRLFEADGVRTIGFFFQNGASTHVRTASHIGTIEKNGTGEIAVF